MATGVILVGGSWASPIRWGQWLNHCVSLVTLDAMDAPFHSVRPRRAVDDIVEQIRARIQSHELSPGQKLPAERDLAEQLGVSRNTVREAIRMLEVSGLVTLKKGAHGGAFLNESNSAALSQNLLDGISLRQYDFADLIDVRRVLETFLVEQACRRADDAEIEELAAVAALSRDTETGDVSYADRLVLHMDFHHKLAAIAHNTVAETLIVPLLEITRTLHSAVGPKLGQQTHEYRLLLIDALRHRDPATATSVLGEHFDALTRRILHDGAGEAPA